ncbi:MAG TPA: hypothetical protein V6C58_24585 [Allocoleopsis sp.]
MAGTFVTSQRRKVYVEDVSGGVSVSESVGSKLGSSINFIFDRIVYKLLFGVGGGLPISSLTTPYTFSSYSEFALENLLAIRVRVALKTSGTAGNTEFYIERRPVGSGTWTNIFSTNCIINHAASDNLVFASDEAAPVNVTLPVLSTTSYNTGDEFRLVLVSAATGSENLQIFLETSPA